MKPEILAIKAVNQYRRRDIISYLGLRYYLMSCSAKRDRWANEISVSLVNKRIDLPYFKSFHYKGLDEYGNIILRQIYLPGPNEALAEISLLTECSNHSSFKSNDCVFSHKFTKNNNPDGVFEYYFKGFKERHNFITQSCCQLNCETVFCTDIKNFYPSISGEMAYEAWDKACFDAKLSKKFQNLGKKLLSDHGEISARDGHSRHLLTGPILSHVIANIVFRDIDSKMCQMTNNSYWRYVDDIAMSGSVDCIEKWRSSLKSSVENLGLELHTGSKTFCVESCRWVSSISDYEDDMHLPWVSLIADVKRYLIANGDQADSLEIVFKEHGVNIPIKSYATAVWESSNLERFFAWLKKYKWSLVSVHKVTPKSLVESAYFSKDFYLNKCQYYLNLIEKSDEFDKKRFISKIRYCSGRLILLLNKKDLMNLYWQLSKYKELFYIAEIMRAVATRDVSTIVKMGTNAAQSVSQVLRLSSEPIYLNVDTIDEIIDHSLGIFYLNNLDLVTKLEHTSIFCDFAKGSNQRMLMKCNDPFIREISCLHGITDSPLHSKMLDQAFNPDEALAIDVIDQIQSSSYF